MGTFLATAILLIMAYALLTFLALLAVRSLSNTEGPAAVVISSVYGILVAWLPLMVFMQWAHFSSSAWGNVGTIAKGYLDLYQTLYDFYAAEGKLLQKIFGTLCFAGTTAIGACTGMMAIGSGKDEDTIAFAMLESLIMGCLIPVSTLAVCLAAFLLGGFLLLVATIAGIPFLIQSVSGEEWTVLTVMLTFILSVLSGGGVIIMMIRKD